MKHILLTTIAAGVVVGCGPKPPDISIHEAAFDGNIEAVKQHVAAGTDINAHGGKYDGTALHEAARSGRKEIAELLIDKGAEVNAQGQYMGTPLHYAIGEGHKEIAELLIAKEADVNAKIEGGGTPLHYAATAAQKEIAELLIAKGADVNAKDEDGWTPLDWAITNIRGAHYKQTETIALLRKHGGKTSEWFKAEESIHIAAKIGHLEAVRQHLAAGANVNANYQGNTVLCNIAIKLTGF